MVAFEKVSTEAVAFCAVEFVAKSAASLAELPASALISCITADKSDEAWTSKAAAAASQARWLQMVADG